MRKERKVLKEKERVSGYRQKDIFLLQRLAESESKHHYSLVSVPISPSSSLSLSLTICRIVAFWHLIPTRPSHITSPPRMVPSLPGSISRHERRGRISVHGWRWLVLHPIAESIRTTHAVLPLRIGVFCALDLSIPAVCPLTGGVLEVSSVAWPLGVVVLHFG